MVDLTNTIYAICLTAWMAFCEHYIWIAEYFPCQSYILYLNGTCCIYMHEVSYHWAENGTGDEEQDCERENEYPFEKVFHFFPSKLQIPGSTLKRSGPSFR